MRFLVLGASGMAGHTLCLYLTERGHAVTPFSRHPLPFLAGEQGDLLVPGTLDRLLAPGRFDVVVNCVGILNRDADAHPDIAVTLNSWLPHAIVARLAGTEARLIHLSTDCVFSGKRGGYREDDLRDGESFYDRSKALGEVEDTLHLTFRNSIVGPDLRPEGKGLLNWFLQQRGPVPGYRRVLWNGVTTLRLAMAVEAAAQQRLAGVYHLVPKEAISKLLLLKGFNQYLRKDPIEILPDDTLVTDKSLVNTRRDFDFTVPGYPEMTEELRVWLQDHAALYPHYVLPEGRL